MDLNWRATSFFEGNEYTTKTWKKYTVQNEGTIQVKLLIW